VKSLPVLGFQRLTLLHKNLLFYLVAIFNALALSGVAVAYQYGLIHKVIEKDISHVTEVILVLVAFGIYKALSQAWSISQLKSDLKQPYKFLVTEGKVLRLKNKILENLAGWAVLLGLFGNTVGFIVALQSPDAILAGANTAFAATALGILAALWMEINYWLVNTDTDKILVHLEDYFE
jgi:hypothetical protein